MHLCYFFALLASSLGLMGVVKVGFGHWFGASAGQFLEGSRAADMWAKDSTPKDHWVSAMSRRKECKDKCGDDEKCIDGCPKPWLALREKCEKAKPVMECHKQCHHDHACHEKCPLPECPKMAQKVKDVLQCRGKCANDRTCHHSCGHPFERIMGMCSQSAKVSACHQACAHGDRKCHAACPKMWGQDGKNELGMKDRWFTAMSARKECKEKCGDREKCVDGCPKPWLFLKEKCEKNKPVMECHKQCHHDHACHEKCPLPECPRMAQKVKDVLQCHGKCGNDRDCHHTCGPPLKWLMGTCSQFGRVSACHQDCTHGDHKCHAACPKMWDHEHLGEWRKHDSYGRHYHAGHHHKDHHHGGHHHEGHHDEGHHHEGHHQEGNRQSMPETFIEERMLDGK
eukprot:TRINITY_DN6635_c0_g1_i1.p1 TRINITY_DN6635_c0_g1~~TRINITY_DN6635_c0_g1_i1.p1  ORF type:complete len:397 (+),score=65.09 TRINITY_DN6635_c0_g1_i1:51-1241(+)